MPGIAVSTKTTSKFSHRAAAFSGPALKFLPTPSNHPLLKIRRGGRGAASDPSTLSEQQFSCRCELIYGKRGSSVYNVLGGHTVEINGLGNRTTHAYSRVGQLTSREYPDGSRATSSYDTVGNRLVLNQMEHAQRRFATTRTRSSTQQRSLAEQYTRSMLTAISRSLESQRVLERRQHGIVTTSRRCSGCQTAVE